LGGEVQEDPSLTSPRHVAALEDAAPSVAGRMRLKACNLCYDGTYRTGDLETGKTLSEAES
jgi:phosphohistidine swiveling domain-containing protein